MEKKCSVCHRPMSDDECAGMVDCPTKSELKEYFAALRKLYAAHDAEIEEFGVHAAEAKDMEDLEV